MRSKEAEGAISNMKKYIEAPKIEQVDVRAGYNILKTKHKLIKEKDLIIVLAYIEELENKLKIQTENYNSAHEDINWFCDNYISKQKIRDKIKELYEDKDSKYYGMFLEQRDIEKTISILKEIIGE